MAAGDGEGPYAPRVLPGFLSAFSFRGFRVLWSGAFVSSVGTWTQDFALNWLVHERFLDPRYLGYRTFAADAPLIAFMVLGGAAADRIDRRRILLTSQFLQMGFALPGRALRDVATSGSPRSCCSRSSRRRWPLSRATKGRYDVRKGKAAPWLASTRRLGILGNRLSRRRRRPRLGGRGPGVHRLPPAPVGGVGDGMAAVAARGGGYRLYRLSCGRRGRRGRLAARGILGLWRW